MLIFCVIVLIGASSDSSSDDNNGTIIALATILAIAVSGLVISVIINVFFIVQRKQSRYVIASSCTLYVRSYIAIC